MFVDMAMQSYVTSQTNLLGVATASTDANPVLIILGILAALLVLVIMSSTFLAESVRNVWNGIFHAKEVLPQDLDELVAKAGYSYDAEQDIFYSNLDAWQRNMGYARLYDEGASSMGMIIDCEPITFRYQGRRWLIEFWKGQYGMTTGGEIGVYQAATLDNDNEGSFTEDLISSALSDALSYLYYQSVGDEDLLKMAFYLRKNGSYLLRREERHWWLTGFKLGEFSEPSELAMYSYLTLKDDEMLDAFLLGLQKAGYGRDEIIVSGRTVSFLFDRPRTPQPLTRQEATDRFVQRNNRHFCEIYQELTAQYETMSEKISVVREKAPELFSIMMMMGRSTGLLKLNKQILRHASNGRPG